MSARSAWLKAGGYPPASGNEDALMDRLLKAQGKADAPLWPGPHAPGQEWSYLYRCAVSPFHRSGHHDPEAGW